MAELGISRTLDRTESREGQFYCHVCAKKFTHRLPDPSFSESQSCPTCGSGFVEELEQEEQHRVDDNTQGSTGATASSSMDSDPEDEMVTEHSDGVRRRTTSSTQSSGASGLDEEFLEGVGRIRETLEALPANAYVLRYGPPPRPFAAILQDHIQRLIDEHEGRRPRQPPEGANNPPPPPSYYSHSNFPPPNNPPPRHPPSHARASNEPDGDRSATDFHFTVGLPWFLMTQAQERERDRERMRQHMRRAQPAPPPQMPRFGGPQMPRFGGPQIFVGIPGGVPVGLHGTPGDYAWGPHGLDNIITQLLANFEDNGPPPADAKKVEALPFVVATEDDLKPCADCSVCKEPFTVGEKLRQLPCFHLYHNDCILPWLKLHDTCPTCRFSINTGKPAND